MSALANRLRIALARTPAEPPLEGDYPELRAQASNAAAVLIAITDRPDPGVLLTVRREHLRTHAGQIAFPGGRLEPGEDAVAAALREAHEEILLDPANHRIQSVLLQGRERRYYEILWNGRRIWGATAAMIVNLSRRLQWT
jgi:8-oxo-dGTP pyrophosphatase MutT (NUDIX family)